MAEKNEKNSTLRDALSNKVFWFARNKFINRDFFDHWPMGRGRYVENLTDVIGLDSYGKSFLDAQSDTSFDGKFDSDIAVAVANGAKPETKRAFSLLAHGFNTRAILGKLRDMELNQNAVKEHFSTFGGVKYNVAEAENWAVLGLNEEPITPDEFTNLAIAEMIVTNPIIAAVWQEKAGKDTTFGYQKVENYSAPSILNDKTLNTFPNLIKIEGFDSILKNIEKSAKIKLVSSSTVAKDAVKYFKRKFYAPLRVMKNYIKKSANARASALPSAYTMHYSSASTQGEQLYSIIKAMAEISIKPFIKETELLCGRGASNLPTSEEFEASKGYIEKASACLIASDLCKMLSNDTNKDAMQILSDYFNIEAIQNISMLNENDTNIMPLIADYHAESINSFAQDFKITISDFAKAKGVLAESAGNFGAVLYANYVPSMINSLGETSLTAAEFMETSKNNFDAMENIFNFVNTPAPTPAATAAPTPEPESPSTSSITSPEASIINPLPGVEIPPEVIEAMEEEKKKKFSTRVAEGGEPAAEPVTEEPKEEEKVKTPKVDEKVEPAKTPEEPADNPVSVETAEEGDIIIRVMNESEETETLKTPESTSTSTDETKKEEENTPTPEGAGAGDATSASVVKEPIDTPIGEGKDKPAVEPAISTDEMASENSNSSDNIIQKPKVERVYNGSEGYNIGVDNLRRVFYSDGSCDCSINDKEISPEDFNKFKEVAGLIDIQDRIYALPHKLEGRSEVQDKNGKTYHFFDGFIFTDTAFETGENLNFCNGVYMTENEFDIYSKCTKAELNLEEYTEEERIAKSPNLIINTEIITDDNVETDVTADATAKENVTSTGLRVVEETPVIEQPAQTDSENTNTIERMRDAQQVAEFISNKLKEQEASKAENTTSNKPEEEHKEKGKTEVSSTSLSVEKDAQPAQTGSENTNNIKHVKQIAEYLSNVLKEKGSGEVKNTYMTEEQQKLVEDIIDYNRAKKIGYVPTKTKNEDKPQDIEVNSETLTDDEIAEQCLIIQENSIDEILEPVYEPKDVSTPSKESEKPFEFTYKSPVLEPVSEEDIAKIKEYYPDFYILPQNKTSQLAHRQVANKLKQIEKIKAEQEKQTNNEVTKDIHSKDDFGDLNPRQPKQEDESTSTVKGKKAAETKLSAGQKTLYDEFKSKKTIDVPEELGEKDVKVVAVQPKKPEYYGPIMKTDLPNEGIEDKVKCSSKKVKEACAELIIEVLNDISDRQYREGVANVHNAKNSEGTEKADYQEAARRNSVENSLSSVVSGRLTQTIGAKKVSESEVADGHSTYAIVDAVSDELLAVSRGLTKKVVEFREHNANQIGSKFNVSTFNEYLIANGGKEAVKEALGERVVEPILNRYYYQYESAWASEDKNLNPASLEKSIN